MVVKDRVEKNAFFDMLIFIWVAKDKFLFQTLSACWPSKIYKTMFQIQKSSLSVMNRSTKQLDQSWVSIPEFCLRYLNGHPFSG